MAEDDKDFAVNFYLEPRQSKSQLKMIVNLVAEHIKSKKHYLAMIKNADADIVILD